MVRVKSVKIDGEKILVFNSAFYIFESSTGFSLVLDIIVTEVVQRKYHNEENLIVDIELENSRIISSIMHLKSLSGGLPQLNLFCELDDPDEYDELAKVSENDSWFPNIEEGLTIEEIRKVEKPNEKVTLKLSLPIDQVEWIKSQKARELNDIFKEIIELYLKK